MLQVHHKYEELIADTFKNEPLFLSALDKACASVINKRINDKQPCRSAELVTEKYDLFHFVRLTQANLTWFSGGQIL